MSKESIRKVKSLPNIGDIILEETKETVFAVRPNPEIENTYIVGTENMYGDIFRYDMELEISGSKIKRTIKDIDLSQIDGKTRLSECKDYFERQNIEYLEQLIYVVKHYPLVWDDTTYKIGKKNTSRIERRMLNEDPEVFKGYLKYSCPPLTEGIVLSLEKGCNREGIDESCLVTIADALMLREIQGREIFVRYDGIGSKRAELVNEFLDSHEKN